MANMSAQILRNLVSAVFNVKATDVVLSGVISPDSTWYQGNTGGGMWSNSRDVKIWGFHPQSGFGHVIDCVGDEIQASNDAPVYYENAVPLGQCDGVDEYLFFVVNIRNKYSDTNGRDENEDSWTLFKAFDFHQYLENVEAADIARWDMWLQNNLDK